MCIILSCVPEFDADCDCNVCYNLRNFLYVRLSCRFLYDGQRINEDDTPASLDMEDNGPLNPQTKLSLFTVLTRLCP